MCEGPHDFIPAPNTARVRLIFDVPDGKAMNVLHFVKATPFDKDDLAALLTTIETAWDAQMSPLQSDQVELTQEVATDINSEDSFEVDRAPLISLVGGNPSPILPGNVTVATKFATGLAGRSNRGRSYHIGLCENQVVGNALVAGVADSIRDAWIDFAGAVHDSDLAADLAIVSYCNEGAWRTTAVVRPVSEFTTENNTDSMRSRLAGRGM